MMRERVDFLLMPCLPSFTQDVLAKSLPFLTDESLIADDISYEGLLATCQGRESYLSAMRDWQQLVPERLEDFKVLSLESWRLNPGVVTARCGARVLKKNGRGGCCLFSNTVSEAQGLAWEKAELPFSRWSIAFVAPLPPSWKLRELPPDAPLLPGAKATCCHFGFLRSCAVAGTASLKV